MSDTMNLDSAAQGWRPEPGQVIVGEVTDVSRAWSDYRNGYYPIVTIQPEGDGNPEPVAVHAFHDVLLRRMVELRPKVGERIGIKFDGQRETKDGKRSVSIYTVKIDGRGAANPEAIWDSIEDPSRATDQPQQPQQDDDIPF